MNPVTTPGVCPPLAESPERVTRDGSALFATESMDGKDVVYKKDFGDSPLLAQPLAAGTARQLVPCVSGVDFAFGTAGSTTRSAVMGCCDRFT